MRQTNPLKATSLGLLASLLFGSIALAQTYPVRPITFLVSQAPGGSADIIARILGTRLQTRLGQPVVVENRAGASETLAAEALARSAPDGYTIAVLSNALAINETVIPNRRYDARKDLVGVAKVIDIPFAIFVNASLPINSLPELIAYAKQNPGKLSYGHLGPGTPHYFAIEWLKRKVDIDIVPIPFRGAAPALAALAGNQIQLIASGLSAATPFVDAGKARAIAVIEPKRSSILPTVPTNAESGLPGFGPTSWMGIFTRAGIPADRLKILEEEILQGLRDPEIATRIAAFGVEVSPLGSKPFAAFTDREVATWEAFIRSTGVKLDQ